MMKKIFVGLIFILISSHIFSHSFGFDMRQESTFGEKTKYMPAYFYEIQTDIFLNLDYSLRNCLISIHPSICFKNEKVYLNLYKFKFNLFFNKLAFSLEKDIFYYGKGNIENLSLPQSLSIKNRILNTWYSKIDLYVWGQTISAGILLDNSIDYYKKPDYLNPFLIFNYNNNYLNVIYTVDYLLTEIHSFKNSLEFEFLSKQDISLYSSFSFATELNREKEMLMNLGISKAFVYDNFVLSPLFEINYDIFNTEIGILLYLHADIFDFIGFDNGLYYSNENTLNTRSELNFFLDDWTIRFFFQSRNLLKDETMKKEFLSVGVKYAI